MQNVVIWAGPVSETMLKSAAMPVPARVITLGSGPGGGIGSSSFSQLGQRYGGSVAEIIARRALDPDRVASVSLVGFSAAHGLFEQLFRNPDSFDRIDAAVCCDAYYTGEDLTPKRGYSAFAQAAAQGRKLMLLTTSIHRGATYPSSQAAVARLLDPFELQNETAPDLPLAPEQALGRSGLHWLRYGARLPHAEHATKLAPALVSRVLTPFLSARVGDEHTGPSSVLFALASAGLLLAATG